ncbi:MAG TPA: glycosyltransferase family 1 protein [Candidatus Saccharimonadales bacterium]|nr:glycosyltransferase family 1 protein [Candidatus Saccharimonadales bacterium]
MSKIALDVRFWRSSTGGLGRYSRNLLTELLKIDQENQYTAIITPDDLKEFHLEQKNLTKLVVDIPHFSYAEQLTLPKILNKKTFDLVHFANFNHPLHYRRPFVLTVHDLIMHLFPPEQSWIRRQAYKMVVNDCKRAEKIIVPSQSTKDDLVRMLKFPAGKIVITPEGSESLFRLHDRSEILSVRKKLQLPEKYLIFVSRWAKYKGLTALIEAFDIVRKKYPDLGLVICGKADKQSPEIAELIKEKQAAGEKIITPGFVDDKDLAAMYSAAAVYVHPSWYEGFGIMILEAFASGVPVVTSNVSSLPEVVGDAGLLCDPRSPEEIARQIEKILGDEKLAERLKMAGLKRVCQYSWAKMAEQTLRVYKECLKKD